MRTCKYFFKKAKIFLLVRLGVDPGNGKVELALLGRGSKASGTATFGSI